jgi:hypothetical protein
VDIVHILFSSVFSSIFSFDSRQTGRAKRAREPGQAHRTRHPQITPSSKAISDGRDVREGAQASSEIPAVLLSKIEREYFFYLNRRGKNDDNFSVDPSGGSPVYRVVKCGQKHADWFSRNIEGVEFKNNLLLIHRAGARFIA